MWYLQVLPILEPEMNQWLFRALKTLKPNFTYRFDGDFASGFIFTHVILEMDLVGTHVIFDIAAEEKVELVWLISSYV